MLRKLRANTKWIMLITAAAFVGLMVFEWGMDASGRGLGVQAGEIGRVNGEGISAHEFLDAQREMHQQITAERSQPLSSFEEDMLEDRVWEQMVTGRLISQELRRRSITVTAEDIRMAARYSPPRDVREHESFLSEDGQFDLSRWHQFLASPTTSADFLQWLEHYYRERLAESRLAQQVVAGAYVTDEALWRMWRDRNEKATFRYVTIDPLRMIPDHEVPVTDAEIRSYYRENRERFRIPGKATVNYVILDKEPLASDTAAARQRIEEIREAILAGADFAETARRESADPGSARAGGDLGWFTVGEMVPEVEDAAFSQSIGQVGEPVQSFFGFHLLEVTDRDGDHVEARHILVPIERTGDSEYQMLEMADSLEMLAEDRPLAEVAGHLGLNIAGATINKEEEFLPGVGPIRQGTRWAFQEGEVGEASPLFDELQHIFYILELVDREPEHFPSLEEAEAEVEFEIKKKKKVDRALRQAREFVDRIRADGTLDELAQSQNLEIDTAGPITRLEPVPNIESFKAVRAIVGSAFGLNPGQVSGAIRGEDKIYIVETLERVEADREEWKEQLEQQRQNVMPRIESGRWEQFIAALWEEADIIDNRDLILRGPPGDTESGWFRRSLPF